MFNCVSIFCCVAMPAAVTCSVCRLVFARPRAYRSHHCRGRPSLSTAAPPAAQVASGDQQWELDDLARVQLMPLSPATPPRPTTCTRAESYLGTPILTSPGTLPSSPKSPLPAPSTPRSWLDIGTQTATSPQPTRREAGTQTSVSWSPTRHARRRVFEPHLRRLDVYPAIPEGYGSYVDLRKARRLCDCRRCVGHMNQLVDADVVAEPVAVPGLRFIQLPVLPSIRGSSAGERSRLDDRLRRRPDKGLLGCGCRSCTTHRELARAWCEALAPQPSGTRGPH